MSSNDYLIRLKQLRDACNMLVNDYDYRDQYDSFDFDTKEILIKHLINEIDEITAKLKHFAKGFPL